MADDRHGSWVCLGPKVEVDIARLGARHQTEAIRRYARIYAVEAELKGMSEGERMSQRQQLAKPLWAKLKQWLEIERRLVAAAAPWRAPSTTRSATGPR